MNLKLNEDNKTSNLVMDYTGIFDGKNSQPKICPNDSDDSKYSLRILADWKKDHVESRYEFIDYKSTITDVWFSVSTVAGKQIQMEKKEETGGIGFSSSAIFFIYFPTDKCQNSKRNFTVYERSISIQMRLTMTNHVDDYRHEFVDLDWSSKLWQSAEKNQSTDVELIVGYKKFGAHRIILSARSPVFNELLSKRKRGAKHSVQVNADVDCQVFQHFLEFLYTGTLKISANNRQLLQLASMYQVETLEKLCKFELI